MRNIVVLGSTGSIGVSALKVIARHPDKFKVVGITAYQNAALLREQQLKFSPQYVGIVAPDNTQVNGVADLKSGDSGLRLDASDATPGLRLSEKNNWVIGESCLVEAATLSDADIVINAVVGAAGVRATIAALEAGKRVALANKESLVMGGELVLQAAKRGGGEIVPVDSEHSAILQCLTGSSSTEVERIYITASGGPFRGFSKEQLENVTVADALKHPTWSMGRKITVDSATLANKALEVIEAHYLFGFPYDRISVVVHPQSLIHSMVEFVDCSVVAQIGVPSMELPILYSLSHPERIVDNGGCKFDPFRHSGISFEPVDSENFPALALGIKAGMTGGVAPAVYNAANEAAVARFLDGSLKFTEIPLVIEGALSKYSQLPADSIEQRFEADQAARDYVRAH